jgi:protein-tyrosine kinase
MSRVFQALEKSEKEKAPRPTPIKQPKPDRTENDEFRAIVEQVEAQAEGKAAVQVSPWLLVNSHPNSIFVEQIKKIRTHIHHCTGTLCPRSILVTSSIQGEGKSLLAANLAVSISQELNDSVLLVDTDIRHPNLHGFFNLPKSPGLSDYLNGETPLSEIIQPTGFAGMRFLAAGSSMKNPIELISSNRMQQLLEELKDLDQKPFIIFDSTPMLYTSEPTILGNMVDGVLFVVRQNLVSRDAVKKALGGLRREQILGLVVNDARNV